MEQTSNSTPQRSDETRPRFLFALSMLFLILMAGLLYSHQVLPHAPDPHPDGQADHEEPDHGPDFEKLELRVQIAGLLVVWTVFVVEGWLLFMQRDRGQGIAKPLGRFLLVCLIPPLRIGIRDPDRRIWLPRLGWRKVDRELNRTVERFFSVPMVVIALMVLPFLAIEYGWRKQVQENAYLAFVVEFGNSVIWLAFAVEFFVMIALADKKLRYCARHWIDVAIITLPVIHFLPVLRVLRVGRVLRLSQLARMGRMYRMQSLVIKAWRALLVLKVVQRVTGRSLGKQLLALEELLVAREEEIAELRQEIADLKKRIAQEKAQEQASRVRETPA